MTPGTPTSLSADKATLTILIVCLSSDPVGVGLAASLSHPGGVTCPSLLLADYSAKWLDSLEAAVPRLKRSP